MSGGSKPVPPRSEALDERTGRAVRDGREMTSVEAMRPSDHDPARDEAGPEVRDTGTRSDPLGHGEGAETPRGAARPEEEEMARARAATAAGRMPGTTHDPNSVTTLTEVEPEGDVYPPKGTEKR
ncbi:MAG: hypothetical protein ACU0BS_00355 [Hasllibacter sp.]